MKKTAPSQVTALKKRVARLEAENRRLKDDLADVKDEQRYFDRQLSKVQRLKDRVSGYIDFGFFWAGGDGSGLRTDLGNLRFPEYAGQIPGSWVFMGDPLSTMINARGHPAQTSESRAIVFDPIKNRGKASFILSTLSVSLFVGVGKSVTINATFDLVPRGRDVSNPDGLFVGDYIEVRRAYGEYIVPVKSFDLSLAAGKLDSVLGLEYRRQDAPDRITVSPSLICRYTCGHPLGLRARFKFLERGPLVFNFAISNGSHFIEGFPFFDETDSNHMVTFAGRLSYKIPLGSGFEIGVSGAVGAQDLQSSDKRIQWHYGFDLSLDVANLIVKAEFVQGKAPGRTEVGQAACGLVPCLRYMGAYGLVAYRATNWFTPYVRADWRDALHESGASFVYISKLVRLTVGLHFSLGTHVLLKGEYVLNRELGRLPQFDNDVVTTSLVFKY